MLAVQGGDIRAFEDLVLTFQRPLVSFFDRLLNNRGLAEEFAQEVFCRIYQYREDYEPRAAFQTYLYRVAKNLWIDHIRRKAHAPRTLSLDAPIGEEEGTLEARVPAEGPAPSARLEAEELAVAIRAAVAGLPEKLRLVFVLGESQGMSYPEISEVLEIPVGTVKSRMHAAVLQLRASLAPVVLEAS